MTVITAPRLNKALRWTSVNLDQVIQFSLIIA